MLDHQIEDAPVLKRQLLLRAKFNKFAGFGKAVAVLPLVNRPAHARRLGRSVTHRQGGRHVSFG
jgi:hypothetical protein